MLRQQNSQNLQTNNIVWRYETIPILSVLPHAMYANHALFKQRHVYVSCTGERFIRDMRSWPHSNLFSMLRASIWALWHCYNANITIVRAITMFYPSFYALYNMFGKAKSAEVKLPNCYRAQSSPFYLLQSVCYHWLRVLSENTLISKQKL